MDSKLYFTVILVGLAWVSISTCSASTNATSTNTTSTNTTSTNTTSTNTTSTNTTATNTTATNTTATNTTATNTTATNTTVAPPLTPNNTVTPLETNLNTSGCGTQRLCVNEPANCDPASGSCSFFSVKQDSGQNFRFGVAGESSGYIATVLSSGTALGGNDTTYICFNDNGTVKFTGANLNNDQLTVQNVSANSVKGKVTGTNIQCEFAATLPALSRSTSRSIGVLSGTYDSSAGAFGTPNAVIRTNAVDLASPTATVQNLAAANTTASPNVTTTANTTSNAMSFRQTLVQALFISAGVMGLAVL